MTNLLSVTHDGKTEAVNLYQRLEMEEVVNDTLTLSFVSFFVENNPGHALLQEESVLHLNGHDFRIKQMKETRNRKEIMAISTFFDLAADFKEEIYGGTRTFQNFVEFLFRGTGWTPIIRDVSGTRFIPNFGMNNVIQLLSVLCAAYECEFKILPNRQVELAMMIGPDNDAQYRYKHNVKALSRNVDTTKLRTRIVAYGANGLKVVYTSPNAEIFGVLYADPISDERFTVPENLIEKAKQELIDYPEVSIELTTVEIVNRELGERVWLIYEPLGIEFQTRVLSKKTVERNRKLITESVVIGNARQKDLSDLLTEQKINLDETARETRSRIEQTNDTITLAVERLDGRIVEASAEFTITADEIRGEVQAANVAIEEGLAQNRSLISQTAAEIRQEVTSDVKRLDGSISSLSSTLSQTATAIRGEVNSEIKSLDGRIDSANASITLLSNSISSNVTETTSLKGRLSTAESNILQTSRDLTFKVSTTDFNGTNIVSMINQTPSHIKIQATNITLAGAVSVLSDITGNLGTINAGNINLQSAIYVGDGVHLRGSGRTGLYFPSASQIFDTNGYMQIESYYGMTIVASNLDLSAIRGSINWGSHKPVAVWG